MFDVKINSSIKFEQEEIINLAKGKRDVYGKPFTVIEIIYKESGLYPFKTGGYQDTLIKMGDHQRIPGISYKTPGKGSIKFRPDKFGTMTAYCAKTPHNMKTLAAELDDEKWELPDPQILAEVKALVQKVEAAQKRLQYLKEKDPDKIEEFIAKNSEIVAMIPDKYVKKRRRDAKVDLGGRRRKIYDSNVFKEPLPIVEDELNEKEITVPEEPVEETKKTDEPVKENVSDKKKVFANQNERRQELAKMPWREIQAVAKEHDVFGGPEKNFTRKRITEAILKYELNAEEQTKETKAAVIE